MDISSKIRRISAEIQEILGWSEAKYQMFRYDNGADYLECYKPVSEHLQEMMVSKTFWGWWKLHYSMRDEMFLELMKHSEVPVSTKRKIYEGWQNGQSLATTLTMRGVVLEHTYSKMIHEHVKFETHGH